MFDETNVTKNELGDYYDFTVNDCVDHGLNKLNFPEVTKDLVVTSESDDMFCYLEIDIPCSLELDYEFANESI